MRILNAKKITEAVKQLCIKANLDLRNDVLAGLKRSYAKETNNRARKILKAVIENAIIAKKEKLAICQDTGMACVFIELGQGLRIKGDLNSAVNKGVEIGYRQGFLRNSIIKDPLKRGVPSSSPAVMHVDLVKGERLKITVLPKGFGCENKSLLRMFNPTADPEDVKKFIVDSVRQAGPDACPPYIVGVGIGGTADLACLLAKKALLGKITDYGTKLEQELLRQINNLDIGPMGLGGRTTALAVRIKTYPTHIAGLPVAVNISCHALRSATGVL